MLIPQTGVMCAMDGVVANDLVMCFEDKSNNNKNKRNIFVCLMCSANVCTDMRMVGCVSGPQPKVKGASTAVLLLSCATADCEY